MKLRHLLAYDQIVIQCHDFPDADTLASGFALYEYFKEKGKNVRLVYSGKGRIQKSNLLIMVDSLSIPVEYVEEMAESELLITVDCQYGEGNVTRFPAKNVAVIDHHEVCVPISEFAEIRSSFGSCSTLVYIMLLKEGFLVNKNQRLSNALYYGLYMDTNGFGEIKHPYDMDMLEELAIDENLIDKMRNSNFSLSELDIAGKALLCRTYDERKRYAVVKAGPCDPNILGLISDLVLQVDSIDFCIVYNELEFGYKLSVRSCFREATANEIVLFITGKLGSGGGHKKKAGGFINKKKYHEAYSCEVEEYISARLQEYLDSYTIVDTERDKMDMEGAARYKKLPLTVGYVKTLELAGEGTPLNIRALEGDASIVANADIYIMVGITGEVYPIQRSKFETTYRTMDEAFELESEYLPTARNKLTGESYQLMNFARGCVALGETYIYAKPLNKVTKVFSKWDYDNYMLGGFGDYLASRSDDPSDMYIIAKDIFEQTYKAI